MAVERLQSQMTPAQKNERFARLKQSTSFLARLGLRTSLIALCSVGAVKAYGETQGKVGSFGIVRTSLTFDPSGDVRVSPGFGEAKFDYFDGIFGVEARSYSVNADVVQQTKAITDRAIAEGGNPAKALADAYKDDANNLAIKTVVKGGLLALGGSIFGGVTAELALNAIRRKRKKDKNSEDDNEILKLRNIAIGPLALILAGGVSIATYNENALQDPVLNKNDALGALVNAGESTFGTVDDYTSNAARLNTQLKNFLELQANVETASATPDNLIPVLLMSDAHSKPCVYDRVKALVEAYHAKAVFNMGDETEWGFGFEMSLFSGDCTVKDPGKLGVPMAFVGGNHDGPAVLEELEKYKNVINLDGGIVKLKIKIKEGEEMTFLMLGDNDPVYTADGSDQNFSDPTVKDEWIKKEVEQADRLGAIALEEKPDIIMVHEDRAAERLAEILGPDYQGVILSGHTHRFRLEQNGKLLWVTTPSAGASGLRGFENNGSSNVNGWLVSYFDKETKNLEKITRFYIDNYGSICSDDIFLKDAPPTSLQQLKCDVAKPTQG